MKPQELAEDQLEGSISRPGLLAKALQPAGMANRSALSLLNLLDQAPPAAQMQTPPTVGTLQGKPALPRRGVAKKGTQLSNP